MLQLSLRLLSCVCVLAIWQMRPGSQDLKLDSRLLNIAHFIEYLHDYIDYPNLNHLKWVYSGGEAFRGDELMKTC